MSHGQRGINRHHSYTLGQVASVPCGEAPTPRRNNSAIRTRLYLHLQRTNYVTPHDVVAKGQPHTYALQIFREASLVEYHAQKAIWVPDVGTLNWLVRNRPETKTP